MTLQKLLAILVMTVQVSVQDLDHDVYSETVSHKSYVDLVSKLKLDQRKDIEKFRKLMDEYLSDLMVTFREKIVELYRIETCDGDLCFPAVDQDTTEHWSDVDRLEVRSLDVIRRLKSSSAVTDVHSFSTGNGNTNVLIAYANGRVRILRFDPDTEKLVTSQKINGRHTCGKSFDHGRFIVLAWCKLPVTESYERDNFRSSSSNHFRTRYDDHEIVVMMSDPNGTYQIYQRLESSVSTNVLLYQHKNNWYMVVTETSGSMRVFGWREGLFRHAQTIPFRTGNGSKIEHFSVDQNSVLIVSNAVAIPEVNGIRHSVKGLMIFRLKRGSATNYELYQTIDDCLTEDFHHFSKSGRSFMIFSCRPSETEDAAAAGTADSYVYCWTDDQFLLWQRMNDVAAVKWQSVNIMATADSREETVIFATTKTDVKVLQHGQRYVTTTSGRNGITFRKNATSSIVDRPSTFVTSTANRYYYLICNMNGDRKYSVHVYRIRLEDRKPETEVDKLRQEMETCVENLHDRVTTVGDEIKDTIDRERSYMIEAGQTIRGTIHFRNDLKSKEIIVDAINISSSGKTGSGIATDPVTVDLSEEKLNDAYETSEQMQTESDDLVSKNGDNNVTGSKIVQVDLSSSGTIDVDKNFETEFINGVNVTELNNEALRKTGSQRIEHPVVFPEGFTTDHLNASRIDGLDIEDDLTRIDDTTLEIASEVIFQNADLIVDSDLQVDPSFISNFVIGSGSQLQTVAGDVVFNNKVRFKSLEIGGLFNGVDISNFTKDAMTVDTEQTITGRPVFSDGLTVTTLDVHGSIDGLNMTELSNSAIYRDRDAAISGRIDFTRLEVVEDVDVEGLFNGIDWSTEVVTLATDQRILAESLTIVGDVTVTGNVTVRRSVNNMDLQADLVRTDSETVFEDRVTFAHAPSFLQDLDLQEGATFNGLDLRTVDDTVRRQVETGVGVVDDDNLTLDMFDYDVVNGVNVTEHVDNLLSKSRDQIISGSHSYYNLELSADVSINGTIDGLRLEDYVRNDDDVVSGQRIETELKFDGDVDVIGSVTLADDVTIDDVDLSILDRSVMKTEGRQEIRGEIAFERAVDVTSLKAGLINGVDVSRDLMLLYVDQTFNGDLNLTGGTLTCETVLITDRLQIESLNGNSFDGFVGDSVMVDEEAQVDAPVSFVTSPSIDGDLQVDDINGVNMSRLMTSVLDKTTVVQTVESVVTFKSDVYISRLTVNGTINGKNLAKYLDDVIRRDTRGFWVEKLRLRNLKIIGDFKTTRLNGIGLDGCLHNSLLSNSTSGTQSIFGDVRAKELTADSLRVSKLLNRINPSDILLTTDDVKINRKFNFMTDVSFDDVVSDGLWNDVNISSLQKTSVLKSSSTSIHGTKRFKSISLRNANLAASINGQNVTSIRAAYLSKTLDQTIEWPIDYSGRLQVDQMTSDWLNSIDVRRLFSESYRRSVNREIGGIKIFTKRVTLATSSAVEVDGDVNLQVIDTVDLGKLSRKMVSAEDDFHVDDDCVFENIVTFTDVRLEGKLNEIDDVNTTSVLLTNVDQSIDGNVNFHGQIRAGEINIQDGKVNGIDLGQLARERVSLSQGQTLPSLKVNGDVTVQGDVEIDGYVNHIHTKDLIKSSSGRNGQYVTGEVTFTDVKIYLDDLRVTSTYVDDHRLDDVIDAYRSTHSWVISNNMTFVGKGRLSGDVYVDGHINGRDVAKFAQQTKRFASNATMALHDHQTRTETSKVCLNHFSRQIQGLVRYVPYFIDYQHLEISARHVYMFRDTEEPHQDKVHLIFTLVHNHSTGDLCNNVVSFSCTKDRKKCSPDELKLPTVYNTTKVKGFPYGRIMFTIFLNFGPASSGRQCYKDAFPKGLPYEEFSVVQITDFRTGKTQVVPFPTYRASDIDMFTVNGMFYMLIINYHPLRRQNAVIYRMVSDGKEWKVVQIQRLPVAGSRSGTVFKINGQTYLILLNSVRRSIRDISIIYKWNGKKFKPVLRFNTLSAYDSEFFTSGHRNFLLISSYNPDRQRSLERNILLYLFSDNPVRLELLQTIPFGGVDVEVFRAHDDILMASVNSDSEMSIYRWEGLFKFQDFQRIVIAGARNLFIYNLDKKLYIAVAGLADHQREDGLHADGNTKIFESEIRGIGA